MASESCQERAAGEQPGANDGGGGGGGGGIGSDASTASEERVECAAPASTTSGQAQAPTPVERSASELEKNSKKKKAAEGETDDVKMARRPAGEESARERLKRHRTEMAGRVRVPEKWGQERLLRDWVDCAVFDRPLVASGLLTARDALVAEFAARRAEQHGRPLRVQNGCS